MQTTDTTGRDGCGSSVPKDRRTKMMRAQVDSDIYGKIEEHYGGQNPEYIA